MSQDKLKQFTGERYLNLETYRKDGRPVRTPVWFADEGDVLYGYTFASAGKVKRMRRNPRVRLAPCDWRGNPKGAWVEATARLEGSAGTEKGIRLLREKYGWKKWIGDFFNRLHGRERAVFSLHFD